MKEIIDVTIRAEATDDRATGWGCQAVTLGTDGDFAVVTDADPGLLAPDKGPPRTGRDRAQNGMFLGQGLLVSGERGGAQFAVDFMPVGVGEELVQELVGTCEFADLIEKGSKRGQLIIIEYSLDLVGDHF